MQRRILAVEYEIIGIVRQCIGGFQLSDRERQKL